MHTLTGRGQDWFAADSEGSEICRKGMPSCKSLGKQGMADEKLLGSQCRQTDRGSESELQGANAAWYCLCAANLTVQ
eukprot:272538-Chlamydomonas_euryale.AAC.2